MLKCTGDAHTSCVEYRESQLLREWGEGNPSDLALAIRSRRASGGEITDLITANPQEHGFEFPQDLLADIVSEAVARARYYQPDPKGQLEAREAVAEYHGNAISAGQVILSPGTSLAYWYAFSLLADPGDEVLCPSPTYPLFDDLARLAKLRVRRYYLRKEGSRWALDPEELAFQLTPRTRAVVLVSPHNPTGTAANAGELAEVARLARKHGFAVILDEVFREFLHGTVSARRPSEFDAPLAITLNGFSKMFALPGIKAAWMVAEGDPGLRDRFLAAAEYVSDTFLPVSEYTQAAMPRILREGAGVHAGLAALCGARMRDLVGEWRRAGIGADIPEAGIYLPVPLPGFSQEAEQSLTFRLVAEHGILVHPGILYDLPQAHLVMTCIHRPPWPIQAIAGLVAHSSM